MHWDSFVSLLQLLFRVSPIVFKRPLPSLLWEMHGQLNLKSPAVCMCMCVFQSFTLKDAFFHTSLSGSVIFRLWEPHVT